MVSITCSFLSGSDSVGSIRGRVTVVIPNWNRRELLTRLLEKLRLQTEPAAQILVVDNGSTDGSAEAAEAAGTRVIRLKRNEGFAHAVNLGIVATRTEWVAVINNDVEPDPEWLQRLVDAADDENAWFATGKICKQAPRLSGRHVCRRPRPARPSRSVARRG